MEHPFWTRLVPVPSSQLSAMGKLYDGISCSPWFMGPSLAVVPVISGGQFYSNKHCHVIICHS